MAPSTAFSSSNHPSNFPDPWPRSAWPIPLWLDCKIKLETGFAHLQFIAGGLKTQEKTLLTIWEGDDGNWNRNLAFFVGVCDSIGSVDAGRVVEKIIREVTYVRVNVISIDDIKVTRIDPQAYSSEGRKLTVFEVSCRVVSEGCWPGSGKFRKGDEICELEFSLEEPENFSIGEG